ncbi:MAG: type I DNA topoisomerase [Oscillospiraceae bacterium]|jgi:DNA topoisomerase-1|nr:type I DNA topoisomerase [Oscillospiraceae bacterium]
MKNLVIVESPAKAKTIEKYLKKNYVVVASSGHVRDLPKSRLGVDVGNNFVPKYTIIKAKKEIIKTLKEKVKQCDKVFLATDPDREGESIAWHVAHVLKLDLGAENRVEFNEITAKGVKLGIANPHKINLDLVNAQQARRILDRIVGYKLSPLLWRKVRRGLSAGRVQSVAVKIIVDRERQIRAFVPVEHWSIEATLDSKGNQFNAKLSTVSGEKAEVPSLADAEKILSDLQRASFVVEEVKLGTQKRVAPPCFNTSTLQQEAYNRLSFSSKRTMKVAQELYEGVSTREFGLIGLVTYIRTDSLRVSDDAKMAAYDYIAGRYGKDYLGYEKKFKKKQNIQDAHEAIRPTDVNIRPEEIKVSLTADQYKLYKIIWERFVACHMADLIYDTVSAKISAGEYGFVATGRAVKFAGFSILHKEAAAEEGEAVKLLPPLETGERLGLRELEKAQHFTQPPARFTEASLIKMMEENGIGRPSTYAPTISTILAREYVEREGRSFKPTGLGEGVNGLLTEYFGGIVDERFTAGMESDLDSVSAGELDMTTALHHFYDDFVVALDFAELHIDHTKIIIPEEQTDEICDVCGARMVVKFGRFGKFLSCEKYPDCSNKKRYNKPTGGICSKCGGKIVQRRSKTGKIYYACENNSAAGSQAGAGLCPNFITWHQPITDRCPICNATLFRTKGRKSVVMCLAEGCDYKE